MPPRHLLGLVLLSWVLTACRSEITIPIEGNPTYGIYITDAYSTPQTFKLTLGIDLETENLKGGYDRQDFQLATFATRR